MNLSTPGSPLLAPISGKAIAAELEMAVLKKLKSNAEQWDPLWLNWFKNLRRPLVYLARRNSTSTPRFTIQV
jgi:hypothetical protein